MHLNRGKVKDQEEETMELITHSRLRNRSSLSRSELEPLSAATPTPPMVKSILLGGTPMGMVGMLLGAGTIAGIHHFFLAFLEGRDAQEQFWIKNSSNAFSTLVQWLCTGSVTISLTQLIWLFLCRRPFTVKQLNHLFGLPDPIETLCLVWSWKIFPIIVMAMLVQALALVSILAPNALEVGSASPTTDIISVATISFANGNGWTTGSMTTCTYTVTTAWERVLSRSFQSDTLIGWTAPAGCGSACNYTIEYAAPALQCSDIGQDEILDDGDGSSGLSNPSAILQSMNGTTETIVYNATSVISESGWNFTMVWRTYHGPSEDIAAAGVQCALYNTTQRAVVTFVNNTAIISPRIISFNDPFSISDHNSDCAAIEKGSNPPAGLSSRASYIVIMGWLCSQLNGQIAFTSVGDKQWFSQTNVLTSNLFSMNETARTFSPNPPDMRRALEETLVNATIALISSEGDMAMVEASVARDRLVWVYHALRLWIPYAVALGCTAVCGAAGLTCIVKNKEVGDLDFSAIARATRNEDLDDVFGADADEDANKDAVLQYGLQRKDERGRFRVFELVK
ncbi:hypothetical protein IW261DRAFT_1679577 [Armillaria novae-zelandiae]|uniref:Transmembrane protein n=1 Tax=Armillaria novae-zelandiae TaxID=153914 RepID=A0AA39UKP4_9AGAR|nr:hypothetical protein IW261DRAFT_1679577 [Armillaria novae-zelandiae]